jgi:prepilin-type N-terminal cleavage/methylation domain-containing protein
LIKGIKGISQNWFTLVELIIVITILGILATIAFISFQWYTKDARDWVRISDIKSIYSW